MIRRFKNQKGFTLIEIIAVIIILAVLLGIGYMAIQKQIQKSKEKAFYTSVANIVNAIKTDKILKETDYCMYDYSKDQENQTPNISSMAVLVHKNNENKIIYSVYASIDGESRTIDKLDFSTTKIDEKSTWVSPSLAKKDSYTYYATELLSTVQYTNIINDKGPEYEITNYAICDLK